MEEQSQEEKNLGPSDIFLRKSVTLNNWSIANQTNYYYIFFNETNKTKASSVYVYVIIYPLNLKIISKFRIHLWVGTVSTASNKVTKWSKQWPRSFLSSLYFQFINITLFYKMFLLYDIEVQNIIFPQILVKLRSSIKWADGVSSITLSQMVSLGSRETNKYYHLYPFLCGMI